MLTKKTVILSLAAFVTPAFASDAIKPVFAWPDNLSAVVSVKDNITTYAGDKLVSETFTGTYHLKTEATDNNLNILHSHIDFHSENNSQATNKENPVQQLIDKISNILPNYSVSKDGKFQKITNLNEIHASISSYLDNFKTHVPDKNISSFSQFTQGALSQERLTGSAAQAWHSLVEQWLGGEYSPDFSVESDFSLPHSLLGGFPVPMVATYSLRGRVPCSRNGVEKSCLRLVMIAKIKQKKLDAIMKQADAQFNQKIPFEISQIEIKNVVVTEPDTLVPHIFEVYENTITRLDGDTTIKKEQKSRTTYKYGKNYGYDS